MAEAVWALGLMSGTSLDGIDASLIRTDGNEVLERGASLTLPFTEAQRGEIREAVYLRGDLAIAEHHVTLLHYEAVRALLAKAGKKAKEIKVIGFHGQTISHRPQDSITWQMGNGALLAEKTGIDVVSDFRRRDVAAGGQGAPLVPLYHAALVKHMDLPVAVLNIGGIANVTWVGRSEEAGDDILALDIMAFDIGPGNVLINEWVWRHAAKECDMDGQLARAGQVNAELLQSYMADPFFLLAPPKSLDRNYFSPAAMEGTSLEDGAATLTAFTAAAVAAAQSHFPVPAKHWYVTGGGRHNPALMDMIRQHIAYAKPVETLGWDGDAIEAQAFAYLAVRSLLRLPLTLPTTTGTNRVVTGGAHYRA